MHVMQVDDFVARNRYLVVVFPAGETDAEVTTCILLWLHSLEQSVLSNRTGYLSVVILNV